MVSLLHRPAPAFYTFRPDSARVPGYSEKTLGLDCTFMRLSSANASQAPTVVQAARLIPLSSEVNANTPVVVQRLHTESRSCNSTCLHLLHCDAGVDQLARSEVFVSALTRHNPVAVASTSQPVRFPRLTLLDALL